MEQTWLNTIQQSIFQEVATDSYLSSQFYFTGGTALSTFYLHHRESEDLDFFSENNFDQKDILAKLDMMSKKYQFTMQFRQIETVNIFTLLFPNKTELKTDFVFYPHQRLILGEKVHSITLDSKLDIATNKLLTIMQRAAAKDFVDLYFLLREYRVWDLITGVKNKFHIEIDPFILASDFTKVNAFDVLPRMIKPLTLSQLQGFFREKAIELGKNSLV